MTAFLAYASVCIGNILRILHREYCNNVESDFYMAVEKPKATRRSPKGERTRAKILDVAERLFAQRSYEAVYQRDVADEADVLIGLVTHHYFTKLSLFEAVINRRAHELNALRFDRLRQIETPRIDQIIDAFCRPLIELVSSNDEGWKNYALLMSKMLHSDVQFEISQHLFKETVQTFIDALHEAMPDTDRPTVTRAFIYSVSVFLNSLYLPGRLDGFVESGVFDKSDAYQVYASARVYMLGGMEAVRAHGKAR